jgi:hypothetical protein
MPVTKKKGAIFAIHADTPDKPLYQSLADAGTPIRLPWSSSQATTTRKVLAVKQATQPLSRAMPSSTNSKATSSKGVVSDDLVKPSKAVPKVPRKPLMEKRTRRVESPTSDAPITNATVTAKAARTPAKKARVTDRTPVRGQAIIAQDGDDTGSPASRTRSKTRSTQSPAAASTIKSRPRRPTLTSTARRPRMDIFDDSENIPVPISKQVLDRKRGKDIVDLLDRAGSDGPDEVEMAEYERAYDEHIESHRKGGPSGSKPRIKGLGLDLGNGGTVWDDGVLSDVSEAYGATASEPRGFRAQ